MALSEGEETFALQLRATGVEGWVREHRFHPTRRWRFDFAWLDQMVAVEIQGGGRAGRHTRHLGFSQDCEKLSVAASMGWRVLPVTTAQVKAGNALLWLEEAIGGPSLGRALPAST